eukprot:COSAG02_NODE_18572_length_931_cov_4.598558_1_plen_85_part_00
MCGHHLDMFYHLRLSRLNDDDAIMSIELPEDNKEHLGTCMFSKKTASLSTNRYNGHRHGRGWLPLPHPPQSPHGCLSALRGLGA